MKDINIGYNCYLHYFFNNDITYYYELQLKNLINIAFIDINILF